MHANKIISVHDRVDKAIENDGEVDITIVACARVEPVEQEDRNVMVHMQE